MTSNTVRFKLYHHRDQSMRQLTVLVLVMLTFPAVFADARSVHSTDSVDIFPQGSMDNPEDWNFKKHLAFTPETAQEDAEYVSGMIADGHMSLGISLPEHVDHQTIWASTSPTDSNASLGAPDGAYHFSSGPDITLGGFNFGSLDSSIIKSVELVIHFEVPDALQQDKARFSVINDGVHDLVKTWSNTQAGLFYMDNGWSTLITNDDNWTWSELSNITINLDYVSVGSTDDSQLRVDAVGLKITMRTSWYGAERVVASSINQFTDWPIIEFDLNTGQFDSVSTAPCGLDSDGGTWTTETIEKPAGQTWGRVHFEHSDVNGLVSMEYKDDEGTWISISERTIPLVSNELQLRFTITETCLTRAWVDVNDPHISVQGSISGDPSGMVANQTRWTIEINGETVANNDATMLGQFDLQVPIGYVLNNSDSEFEVKIKVWYNWGNDGSPSSISLRINKLDVIGAYSIEYDEDPVCGLIGSYDLLEDSGGLILPLLSRCSDDRTPVEDLVVTFENSNPDVVEVDLTVGQVRIKLLPEASGTAQIVTKVYDAAGNYWSETSTINVGEVDDEPVLEEFVKTVPVEHGYLKNISFFLSDEDTFNQDLTVTTNRSWATVDMTTREILVNPPIPGITTVLITACDESNCVERVLELEVIALAELYIEDIRLDDDIHEGDIFEIMVLVRNSGQVSARLIEVKCYADGQPFGSGTIPLLEAGQSGFITCDMQAPYGDDSVIIEAEVDRGTQIAEVDEDNNIKSKIIVIGEEVDEDSSSDSGLPVDVGQNAIYIGSAVVIVIIVALFMAMAPPKIKKLE